VPPPQGSWAQTPPPASQAAADARAALLAPDGTAPALLQGEKQPLPLFALLPEKAFVELAQKMKLVERRAGERLITEGETGDLMYMVASGQARVEKGGARVARLREGAIFGDLAVLFHRPRNATVAADLDVELLEISREALAALDCPEALETFARRRTVAAVLASSPLFQRIPDDERKLLAGRFRARAFDAGEKMVEQGSRPPGLFIIVDGESDVTVDGRKVARLKEMDTFGEVSLLRHGNATATVTALRATACALVPRDEFLELTLRWPEVRRELLQVSLDRLKQLLSAARTEADGETVEM
jgi:CRP-like cAMP-binding protein